MNNYLNYHLIGFYNFKPPNGETFNQISHFDFGKNSSIIIEFIYFYIFFKRKLISILKL
jgi:hypothetical protein